MSSAAWPIQKALVALVEQDAYLRVTLAGDMIYSDLVPSKTATPYLTLGDVSEAPFRVFGKKGKSGTDTIHIWSRKGRREVLEIFNALDEALDGTRLALEDGHVMLFAQLELTTVFLDPDNITMHGVVTYSATTQAA